MDLPELLSAKFWIDGGSYSYSGYFAQKALIEHDKCVKSNSEWMMVSKPPEIHRIRISQITSIDLVYSNKEITGKFGKDTLEYFDIQEETE